MDITAMMTPERIVSLGTTEKDAALIELADLLGTTTVVNDANGFRNAILEREEILSTGIGQEFAVPHAKIGSVTSFAIAIGICAPGMEFGSLDKLPVRVIVMIAAPEGEQNTYLKVLRKVTEVLKVKANRALILDLVAAGEKTQVIDLFKS